MSDYKDLKNYDRTQAIDKDSTLKNKDSLIRKSWMLGLIINGQPKAYNWRQLFKKSVVNDTVNKMPLVVTIEPDSLTYHAFNSIVNGKTLHFKRNIKGGLTDIETASIWNGDGLATSGILKGCRLNKIQAYQEYWHSWQHFHPNTIIYRNYSR